MPLSYCPGSPKSFRCLIASISLACVLGAAANLSAQTESTIFNFVGYPASGPVLDSAGNLYGVTVSGGTTGHGSVYKLSPSSTGWQETVLYSFTGGADGQTPSNTPVFDKHGNLYGTTQFGGAMGAGVVYQLSPTASGEWKESVLYSFTNGKDGAYPYYGNLLFDNAGNLYGSNAGGGNMITQACQYTFGCGVIFRLSPLTNTRWKFSLLHTFSGGVDGIGPAALMFDSKGTLFGSAAGAWSGFELPNQPGLVFTLTPTTSGPWKDSVVYAFGGNTDGGLPSALTFDNSGNIYGVGGDGGILDNWSGYGPMGCGVVFKISPTSNGKWKETALYAFTGGADGGFPDSGLVFDNGNLFGLSFNGGSSNSGVVYELTPAADGSWTQTVIHSFSGSDGLTPRGPLVMDSAGHLFGTTSYGGSSNGGVAFEIIP